MKGRKMQKGLLKKGDLVKVVAGKEKGKSGKILKTIADKDRVIVEKVNLVKKHQKPDQKSKGGIVEKEAAIHRSNVMYLCGKCNKAARLGIKIMEDGKKARVCNKCRETLDT